MNELRIGIKHFARSINPVPTRRETAGQLVRVKVATQEIILFPAIF